MAQSAAPRQVSEQEARRVAEASRPTEWREPSFLRELFLGNFRLDLVHPYPLPTTERPEFTAFFGALAGHLRYVERTSRELAREVFHGMNVYQGKLQHKQAFLFRLVDVTIELFAMAAAVSRARLAGVRG